MRKFLVGIVSFFSIILLFLVVALFLPTTPRASKSLILSKNRKDSLLKNTSSPRIIFIGGSNLSFGLNSQMIKDSLKLNPINTGLHAVVGLVYMMDNTLPYLREGDIVVVSPEYHQFYNNDAYGKEELLRTLCDIRPFNINHLRWQQWENISPLIPKYCLSKINPLEYLNGKEDKVYGVNSFNEYGDAYKHWRMQREEFSIFPRIYYKFESVIIEEMLRFRAEVEKKKAKFYVTFPCYQDKSFDESKVEIKEIEATFRKNKFTLLGSPERNKMHDSLMFNTTYHLIKKGLDYRTNLLIEDLKKKI